MTGKMCPLHLPTKFILMSVTEKGKFLVKEITELLISQNKTLSVAESCTGGKISSIITSVSRSSNFFKGGIIAYSNQVKIDSLAVKQKDLEKHSAVSEKVAMQMAEGIKNEFLADYAIATTGYAGPEGEKVGQVFIACSSNTKTIVKECFFKGERREIVNEAAIETLTLLLAEIKK